MRSLTVKMVLAFLATSVVGVALALLLIRQFNTREFEDYVIAQQRADFIALVSDYYAAYGSWEGVESWLRRALARDRFQPAPAEPRRPVESYQRRIPPLIRFVLIDTDGTVVIPFERYGAGERVEPGALARGTPVTVSGSTVGTVITPDWISFRDPDEERYLARTAWVLGVAALVAISIAFVLGVLQARLITRPLRDLGAAAARIAAGDLSQRVPVRSQDELGQLAIQFNHMSDDLSRANQLRRQMTADIAHDLRTPLTVIAGYLESLRDEVLKPTPERFAAMYSETQLLLRLVEDLHTLSLADAGELQLTRQAVAPRTLIERAADTYRCHAEQQDVALTAEAEQNLPPVSVDPEQLARALSNLVSNALRHTPAGGAVRLSARAAAGGVELAVSDTGEGIAPEHLPNIFERFYRVDAARSQESGGSGLGLAIVKSIVAAHGGEVRVESTPGQGTTFTITLKDAAEEALCSPETLPLPPL